LLPDGREEILNSFNILRNEIRLYNIEAYKKDYMVVLNKCDLLAGGKLVEGIKKELREKSGSEVIAVSAVTGKGIDELIPALHRKITEYRKKVYGTVPVEKKEKKVRLYTLNGDALKKEKINIRKTPEGYVVENEVLERIVQMTDLENSEALDYLKDRFKKMKVAEKLKEMGVKEDSTVIIGRLVFELVE
ncbi:MAG: Obg family GTPase CgtA, partial [Actinobacteria bacterium]|nr:Obg family GTPase CgtA [Actinomycetota bacterium]